MNERLAGREERSGRRGRAIVVVASMGIGGMGVSVAGCLHDFSVFDPVAGEDAGGVVQTVPDAGGKADAGGGGVDAGKIADAKAPVDTGATHLPEASTAEAGSSCGADCRIEATSCDGTCAYSEQSCAAECTDPDSGACLAACLSTQASCRSQCVTQCETCTSGEGCVDVAGCNAAAP